MTKPLHLIDERQIADAVAKNISLIPGVHMPNELEANVSTVGPGWRVWGIGVHRVAGELEIEIELIVTLNETRSIPTISARVRRKARATIQSLTTEPIRRLNLRITDIFIEE
jgi:uncharacterized alkaline shock family protein YloU